MLGAEKITKMRQSGYKPASVCIELSMPRVDWSRLLPSMSDNRMHVHIDADEARSPELLDLRFLNGIALVMVSGNNDESTENVARACIAAGAKVVNAIFYDHTNPHRVDVVKALRIAPEGEKTVWPQ
jgi:hypothetical protein